MNGPATIYIELLNEGTEVLRPVNAERIEPGVFLILGPVPGEEEWKCLPGALVRCELRQQSGDIGRVETSLVAVELLDRRYVAD